MARREYELTKPQYDRLIEACQPVPYILGSGGVEPLSQQARANYAWCELGRALGFDGMTVQPSDKGEMFFTAESAS